MSKQTNLSLSVAGVTIHQKEQLYCLNDLHKASGGEDKHKPDNFLRNSQAKELIQVLGQEENFSNLRSLEPIKVVTGRNGGTYACKELVYAYAMWISAKFHLHVIRAYDALVNDVNNRAALAGEYRPMTDTLKRVRADQGKETQLFHYSNEADLINLVLTGLRARDFKQVYHCDSVRDNLTPYGREAMISLQRANTALIELGMGFDSRREQLRSLLAQRWAKQALIDKNILSLADQLCAA